jgi:hypothetical protein
MTTYTGLMQGGASGEVVSAGSAGESYLWMLVSHESEPFMPPKADKLPEGELAILKTWIDGGALENAGSKAVMKKPRPAGPGTPGPHAPHDGGDGPGHQSLVDVGGRRRPAAGAPL